MATRLARPAKRDVSRLPTWAQHTIARLEEDLARAKAEALAATTPGESNTQINDYLSQEKLGLPPFSRVRFGTDRDWIEVRLLDRGPKSSDSLTRPKGETVIEVYSGTGPLSVHPSVSNAVRIKAEDR